MASRLVPSAEDFERARLRRAKPFHGEHRKRATFSPVTWAKSRARTRRWARRPDRRNLMRERSDTGAGHATGCLYCGTRWAKECPEPIPPL